MKRPQNYDELLAREPLMIVCDAMRHLADSRLDLMSNGLEQAFVFDEVSDEMFHGGVEILRPRLLELSTAFEERLKEERLKEERRMKAVNAKVRKQARIIP